MTDICRRADNILSKTHRFLAKALPASVHARAATSQTRKMHTKKKRRMERRLFFNEGVLVGFEQQNKWRDICARRVTDAVFLTLVKV